MVLQNTGQGSEKGARSVGKESPRQLGSVEGLSQWTVVEGVWVNRKWWKVPTLYRSSAHQGNRPAPLVVPAQHSKAKAVRSGGRQVGQQESVPRGVDLEDKMSAPSQHQLLYHHQTNIHISSRHRPVQGQVGGLGLTEHIFHRARL